MANRVLQCLLAVVSAMAPAIITIHIMQKVPSPPGALDMQNSHVLTTRVELRWDASPGYVDNYLVMLKNCAGDVVAKKSTESTQPSVFIDNPHTGTTYEVVIWAVAGGKLSDPVTATIRVKESQLKFRDLLVKEIRTTSVMLEWTRSAYNLVQNYKVKWYPVNSKSIQIKNVAPDETSMYIEDLTPGQLFKFIVTSYIPSQCGDEERVQSEDISVRTPPASPGELDMQNSHVLTTRVELRWEASPGYVDNYVVVLKNCAGDVVAEKRTKSTQPSVSFDNPHTGTTYEVVIWAVADGKLSDHVTATIRVKESQLKFRDLLVKEIGTASVVLEWTRPAYNLVQNYKVKWYPVNSKSIQIKNVAPDETSMYIEDLTPGQLFKFIVTSYIPSQCGDEERVQSKDISVRTPPASPGELDMQNSHVLTTRVELRWEASPGYVDNYVVVLKNCAGDVVAEKRTKSTQPSVSFDNPHTGTTYEVVIWAVADGKLSDHVTATIRVKESQLKFRDLLVKEIGTASVVLEWTRPAYNLVQNYKVKWYPVNSKSIQIKNVAPDETSMYIEDLTPGQLFKFIVTSYIPSQCGDEERVQSKDISVRTPPASPGELDMQNSHVLTTRVELRWEASPGYVDNYVVVLKNCAGDVVAEKRTKSTQPSVSFDNPHTGTTYEVVIWAVADGKLSDHVTATIRVKESQLKFRDLLAKEIRTTSVMLEWTRPAYNLVQNYKVKWYPVNSKSVQIKNVAPDETSMYIEDLTPGQLFKFIVTSYIPSQCGDEERVQSEDISLRTLEEGLPQPPFIEGSSAKSTTINLKFIKTLQNIMKQIIIRKTDDNSEVVRLESRKDSVLVDEGLEINTLYEIEIYVKTGGKISGSQFLHMRTKNVKVSMPCLIGGILGGTIAIAGFGPLLCLLGFGGGGIIGGSMAALLMKLGTIKAGSLFAILQSVGVIGLSVAGKAKLIAAGIAVGCMVEELI